MKVNFSDLVQWAAVCMTQKSVVGRKPNFLDQLRTGGTAQDSAKIVSLRYVKNLLIHVMFRQWSMVWMLRFFSNV